MPSPPQITTTASQLITNPTNNTNQQNTQSILRNHQYVSVQEKQQSSLLQIKLKKHNLENIQQLAEILFDQQLSSLFKQRYPQLSQHFYNDESQQPEAKSPNDRVKRLQKMALQHSYHEMYIYYQQFPCLLDQCKNVLKYKYQFDDILRTHNNRKSIWLLCSGALARMKENPLYYESLEEYRVEEYKEYYSHTIEKDVVRTISEQQPQQRDALRKILRNFAIRNPYIGYCQGMNFIASFLLQMQFTEQQIFWLIVEMFQNHIPKSYYTNMSGVGVDICIMEYYIKQYYPALSQKLVEMGLSLSLFTLQWLVCLFTSTLPFYVQFYIISYKDARNSVGHAANLRPININQVIINNPPHNRLVYLFLKLCRSAQLLIKIQEKKKSIFIDQNKFIKRIVGIYVDEELLGFCRELIELKLSLDKIGEGNNNGVKKISVNKKNIEIMCNVQWPICHKTLKSYKTDLGQIQVWTFKQENPPKSIKDYLEIRKKQSYKPIEDNRPKQKKLLIGRIPHTCDVGRYNRKQSIGKESIELEEFNKSQRKIIFDKLESITQKLGVENQHVMFFRRAAQEKLDLLQFSILNKGNKNAINSVVRSVQNDQNAEEINGKNTKGTLVEDDNIHGMSSQNRKNVNLVNEIQQNNSQTVISQNVSKKTRNPFKKLRIKWHERKNKQTNQEQ